MEQERTSTTGARPTSPWRVTNTTARVEARSPATPPSPTHCPARSHSLRVWTIDPGSSYDSYSGTAGQPGYYVSEDGQVLTDGPRDRRVSEGGVSVIEAIDPQRADTLIGRMGSMLVR